MMQSDDVPLNKRHSSKDISVYLGPCDLRGDAIVIRKEYKEGRQRVRGYEHVTIAEIADPYRKLHDLFEEVV